MSFFSRLCFPTTWTLTSFHEKLYKRFSKSCKFPYNTFRITNINNDIKMFFHSSQISLRHFRCWTIKKVKFPREILIRISMKWFIKFKRLSVEVSLLPLIIYRSRAFHHPKRRHKTIFVHDVMKSRLLIFHLPAGEINQAPSWIVQ